MGASLYSTDQSSITHLLRLSPKPIPAYLARPGLFSRVEEQRDSPNLREDFASIPTALYDVGKTQHHVTRFCRNSLVNVPQP
jgi:hypothetical protein